VRPKKGNANAIVYQHTNQEGISRKDAKKKRKEEMKKASPSKIFTSLREPPTRVTPDLTTNITGAVSSD
jgi:hypothetical protein